MLSPEPKHLTVEEAKAMFLENPGLSMVVTTEGQLHRNGQLDPAIFIHNPNRDGTPLHGDLPDPGLSIPFTESVLRGRV